MVVVTSGAIPCGYCALRAVPVAEAIPPGTSAFFYTTQTAEITPLLQLGGSASPRSFQLYGRAYDLEGGRVVIALDLS